MSKISDYFDLEYGKFKEPFGNLNDGKTPFISSGDSENGVVGFFEVKSIYKNVISVARTGSVGSSFYHPYDCLINSDCIVLKPKKECSSKEMLTFTYFLNKNRYRYSYARKVTPQRLGETEIPSQLFEIINSQIPSIEKLSKPYHQKQISLKDREWKWFEYQDLFEVKRGNLSSLETVKDFVGENPVITATFSNNGISFRTSLDSKIAENTITIANNGSIGEAFYQSKGYNATSDISVLYPKFNLNQFKALFLTTLIRKEQYRFSYGRKWGLEMMRTSKIKLPINSENQPDWEFMEDYIKSLPYSASL